MSTSTSRGRTSKMRPLTIEPSRKSGIGFDMTSCICTIIKKASLGHAIPPGGTDFSVQLKHRKRSATLGVFAGLVNRNGGLRAVGALGHDGACPSSYLDVERAALLSIFKGDVDLTNSGPRCVG